MVRLGRGLLGVGSGDGIGRGGELAAGRLGVDVAGGTGLGGRLHGAGDQRPVGDQGTGAGVGGTTGFRHVAGPGRSPVVGVDGATSGRGVG